MAITFRRFNAQVKDPITGNMVPAGLLSTDSLEAIDSAKTTAVNTINAAGQAVRASLPQTWDDLNDTVSQMGSDLAFDENLINEGIFTITSDDLVSGTWSYGNPSSNSTRIRIKNAIPVHPGMTLTYTVGAYDIWYGVLETLESQSFLQGGQAWDTTSGTKTIKINVDGYLTFVIKDHRSTSISGGIDITPEDWDSTAIISIKGPVRGIIPKDGTDFNTIKLPGIYFITSAASSYANCPLPSTVSGTLEVFIGVANRTVQRITRMKNGDMYVRTANGLDSFEDVEWNYIPSRQQSPILAGTDLNTVTNVGIYFIGQAAADTYANCPLPANVAGTLEVFAGSSPFGSYLSLVQRLTRHTDGATYIRTSITGSFENRAWHCIEPSDKGAIPNGIDFDNIVTEGVYFLSPDYQYSNNPLSDYQAGILEVIASDGKLMQRVTDRSNGNVYIRATQWDSSLSGVSWKRVGGTEVKGTVSTGTDFDSIKEIGIYSLGGANFNYVNSPLADDDTGVLEVMFAANHKLMQRVTALNSGNTYIRISNGAERFNTPWQSVGSFNNGIIPNGTDFNTIKDYGCYRIDNASGVSYSHNPLGTGKAGLLEVLAAGSASALTIMQRVTQYSDGCVYVRVSLANGSFANRDWVEQARLPQLPDSDGNYVLKVSISGGIPSYTWASE